MSHTELLNPPDSVVQAVATLTQACQNWPPTIIPDAQPMPPPSGSMELPTRFLESALCNHILYPDRELHIVLGFMVMAVILSFTVVWMFQLHKLPGMLLRLVQRGYFFMKEKAASYGR